jgi:transitional endoplasmic reticulum ATPase
MGIFLKELPQSSPVLSFWITDRLDIFEKNHLSIFDLCIEFKTPPKSVVEEYLINEMNGFPISNTWAKKIINVENIGFKEIHKISTWTKLICKSNPTYNAQEQFENLLQKNIFLSNGIPENVNKNEKDFDLNLINADMNLNQVYESLNSDTKIRICEYGPSGTGKSEYAHQIAKLLNRPLIIKKGSDILGKYIGESEKNLANAFQEVKNRKGVLLLDEVDSLLCNRSETLHSWEASLVNELLTQIDIMDEILIVTTNHLEKLDPAAMRRFDLKIKFDYLLPAQIEIIWKKTLYDLKIENNFQVMSEALTIKNLSIGDFINTNRQSKFIKIKDANDLLCRLKKETSFKCDSTHSKSIGFI